MASLKTGLVILGLVICTVKGFGAAPKDVAEHVKFLRLSQSAKVKAESAQALGKLGAAAKSASGCLCVAMMDKSLTVRVAASEALGKVNPDLYPHVVALLTDQDSVNHIEAATGIRKLPLADGKAAAPVLVRHLAACLDGIERMKSEEFKKKWNIALRTVNLRLKTPNEKTKYESYAVSVLMVELLNEADLRGIRSLGDKKEHLFLLVHADLQALVTVAGDDPRFIRIVSALLHCKVANSPTKYGEASEGLKNAAILALQGMADKYPRLRAKILACLLPHLKDSRAEIRKACLKAIRVFGKDGKKACRPVRVMKNRDPSEEVREEAAETLKAICG